MPMVQRRKIELLNDAVKAKGLGSLSNIDLLLVKAYPFRFPTATPAELERVLADFGDQKGAGEHLANLGITDAETALHVRAALGAASGAVCKAAKAAGKRSIATAGAGSAPMRRQPSPIIPTCSRTRPARAHNGSTSDVRKTETTR